MARLIVGRDVKSTVKLMDDLMDLPEQLQDEMLMAEAQVVYRAQKQVASINLDEMGFSTGTTAKSLTIGKPVGKRNRNIKLYFKGTRGKGKAKRKNALVAYYNEVGSKHVRSRMWIKQTNELCADEAVGAAAKVYDEWLRSRGQ